MLELGLKSLLSYLIGSVMGGLVVGRLRGGVDIRRLGSGNAGGTNALRTQGRAFALGVILIDVSKGALAPLLLPALVLPGVGLDPAVNREALACSCGFMAVAGHVYPLWYDFRGGKGAATALGALLVLSPQLLVPGFTIWALVLTTTGFVGLSTIAAALGVGVAGAALYLPGRPVLVTFLALLAALIVFTHRSNVRRMWQGTENRQSGAMLFRRRSH